MSVMLMRKGGGREANGVTDALGNLEIKNLEAGRYYPIVMAPGVVTPLAHIDLMSMREATAMDEIIGVPTIEVDGLTNVNTEIPAKRGGSITGRVAYTDGDPAIGVKVEVLRRVGERYVPTMPSSSNFMASFMAMLGGSTTDDRGVYRFSGLPEGEYIVKVTENVVHADRREKGHPMDALLEGTLGSLVSVFFENALRPDDAVRVSVQLGQEIVDINVIVPDRALHTISGKVVAAKDKFPVRGASLKIKRIGDDTRIELPGYVSLEQGMRTDSEGYFEFRDVPKGRYLISVVPGSSEFDKAAQAYGEDPDRSVDFDFTSANTVNSSAGGGNAIAGRGGRAVRPPLPALAKTSKEFVVEDEDLNELVVELPIGATIMGVVASHSYEGLSGMLTLTARSEVTGLETSDSTSFYDYSEEDDKPRKVIQKDFRLSGLSPGKTYFTIKATNDSYYVKSAASNQVDLLAGPVEFKSGETLANIRIVLASDTGTLKGKLIDDEKKPIAGFPITFVPSDKTKAKNASLDREARTDANGEFEIKLPPFEYAIVFKPKAASKPLDPKWLETALRDAEKVQIDAGRTSTITIKRNATY